MSASAGHPVGSCTLLLLSVIHLEILSTAIGGSVKTTCTSVAIDQISSVNLTCTDARLPWFHVIQMQYSPHLILNNCSSLATDNDKIKSNSGHQSFELKCVGKQLNDPGRCREYVSRLNEEGLNGTQFVIVDYECLNESLMYNMCENVSLEIPGDVYLASPDMFHQPVNNALCRCRVKAAGLQLQALYIFLNDGNHLNVTCQQCSFYHLMYYTTFVNINVTNGSSENTTYSMDMDFRDNVSVTARNRVWLKISSTRNITIQCNGGMISTVSPSITSVITSTSTTTTTSKISTHTEPSTSNLASPANTSDSSTQGSAALPTSASPTSTLISTTHNTTVLTATPTSTSTVEHTTATSSSDSTHLTTSSADSCTSSASDFISSTSSVVIKSYAAGDSTP